MQITSGDARSRHYTICQKQSPQRAAPWVFVTVWRVDVALLLASLRGEGLIMTGEERHKVSISMEQKYGKTDHWPPPGTSHMAIKGQPR